MREKAIEVNNLSFTYPDNSLALDNVNLTVERGESFAIVGPNGAGKSTLLLHLNGVLRGEGEVKVLGRTISKESLKEIRTKVGIVFQDPSDQLFMPTVFDDIAFGLLNSNMEHREVEKKTIAILEKLKLEGYEKKQSHHLSLGEKKKVSLATVLVMEPEVLVLDEPTSSLDPGTRRIFIEFLKGIEKTKIIATHDLDLVWGLCSKVALLDNGRIIEEGNCREMLVNRELLEEHNLEIPVYLRFSESLRSSGKKKGCP